MEFSPKSDIRIEQIRDSKTNQLPQIAELYAEVFAGPPWNEYTQCDSCDMFYGLDSKPEERCACEGILKPAYPKAKTISYINKELSMPDSVLLLLQDGKKLAGFSWAYAYESPEQFTQEKYRTPNMQQGVADLMKNIAGITGRFFYFSESGIDNNYRGRGLTNEFYKVRLGIAKEKGLPVVVRTNCDSPIMAVANTFGMKQIMGPEVVVNRQSRTIQKTGLIVNNFQDSEIVDRVLLVLQ